MGWIVNEPNVEALAKEIMEAAQRLGTMGLPEWSRAMAEALDAHGVSIPMKIPFSAQVSAEVLKARLERAVLKGEPIIAGEQLRAGDHCAFDPDTGKLIRWREGLDYAATIQVDVEAEAEIRPVEYEP